MATRRTRSSSVDSSTSSTFEHSTLASALPHSWKNAVICTIHEVESWQNENQYLLGHYRTVSNSYKSSLASLGYLHNQTCNAYTHIIGAALFGAWAFQAYNDILTRYPTSDFDDFLAFGVFFAGAFICFGLSATFHIFGNHSLKVYQTWLLLDLYGIFALIIATVYSGTYYGFYCEKFWWKVYSAGIFIITFSCAIFCTNSSFRGPKWKKFRALLFVAIGWYGAIPMTHMAQKWGRPKANEIIGWNLWFFEGLSYAGGAVIYAFRIPERWMPGTFDIWGASHQIFHIFAVIGAALHYQGLLKGFDYNHNPATRQC
ncbi:HlyIII-domain-containing protein [Microthyrium microscopicum]|uniref:HlyIII-domain-containing protein n=1 Tax=Microthyrium microscopicum TaxID=703497 RepID=A0A6A6UNY9_9PEZI|nr:HlyIII-domain-containing protein [Microthyrium microscopicum]